MTLGHHRDKDLGFLPQQPIYVSWRRQIHSWCKVFFLELWCSFAIARGMVCIHEGTAVEDFVGEGDLDTTAVS